MSTPENVVHYPSAGTMRAALIAVTEAEAKTPLEKQAQHVLYSLGWALTPEDVPELDPETVADAIVDAVPFPEDDDDVEPTEETEIALETGVLEEDDWLGDTAACQIRPDGTVDEDCEACQ